MVAIKTEGRKVSLERCHRHHPWAFFISFIICARGNDCIAVCRCTADPSDLIVMETGNCLRGITTPLFLELYQSRVVRCIMHAVSPLFCAPTARDQNGCCVYRRAVGMHLRAQGGVCVPLFTLHHRPNHLYHPFIN